MSLSLVIKHSDDYSLVSRRLRLNLFLEELQFRSLSFGQLHHSLIVRRMATVLFPDV